MYSMWNDSVILEARVSAFNVFLTFANHLKHMSLSNGNTGAWARLSQTIRAWFSPNQSWPSLRANLVRNRQILIPCPQTQTIYCKITWQNPIWSEAVDSDWTFHQYRESRDQGHHFLVKKKELFIKFQLLTFLLLNVTLKHLPNSVHILIDAGADVRQ